MNNSSTPPLLLPRDVCSTWAAHLSNFLLKLPSLQLPALQCVMCNRDELLLLVCAVLYMLCVCSVISDCTWQKGQAITLHAENFWRPQLCINLDSWQSSMKHRPKSNLPGQHVWCLIFYEDEQWCVANSPKLREVKLSRGDGLVDDVWLDGNEEDVVVTDDSIQALPHISYLRKSGLARGTLEIGKKNSSMKTINSKA